MKVFCIPISKQFDAKLNGKAHGKVYALRLEGDKQTRDSEVWGVVSRMYIRHLAKLLRVDIITIITMYEMNIYREKD